MKPFFRVISIVIILAICIWAVRTYPDKFQQVKYAVSVFFDSSKETQDISLNRLIDADKEVVSGNFEKRCIDEETKSVRANLGGCSFTIEESDDEKLYVSATNVQEFQCYSEEETLNIIVLDSEVGIKEDERTSITLWIPKSYRFDSFEINLGTGIVECDELYCNSFLSEVGAGKIEINHLYASELLSNTGVGMTKIGATIEKSAQVKCSVGYVEMELDGNVTDYNYEVVSAVGNVLIDGEAAVKAVDSSIIDNGADKNLLLDCAVGNITVNFSK